MLASCHYKYRNLLYIYCIYSRLVSAVSTKHNKMHHVTPGGGSFVRRFSNITPESQINYLCNTKLRKLVYKTIIRLVRKLRNITINFVMSVRPSVRPSVRLSAWNRSAPAGQIFMKADILGFFEDLSRKFKFDRSLTRITGTVHDALCTFVIVYRWIFRKMGNVSNRICRKNQNTHFITYSNFSLKPYSLWDNVRKYGSQAGHRWQFYTAQKRCDFCAGWLR
jgi:hypothetical protein